MKLLREHYNTISFCNKNITHIKSTTYKKYLVDEIYNLYNIDIIKRRRYYLYKKENSHYLRNYSYLLSTCTRGNPYYIYFTKNKYNQKIAFFIDTKVKKGFDYPRIIVANFRCKEEVYDGTLLLGELVKNNKGDWCIFINDVLVSYGKTKSGLSRINRIKLLNNLLTKDIQEDLLLQPCPLRIKKFFACDQFNKMIKEFIPHLSYSCYGILLHPIKPGLTPLLYRFEKQIGPIKTRTITTEKIAPVKSTLQSFSTTISDHIKFKNSKNLPEIKANFVVMETQSPDVYRLYVAYKGKIKKYSYSHIPNIKISLFMKDLFKNKLDCKDIIIECLYSPQFDKWIPQRKSDSTSPSTYKEIKELKKNKKEVKVI